MKNFKLSSVIYFIIVLFVLVGGYFLISHNPKPGEEKTEAPKANTSPTFTFDKSLATEVTYTTPTAYSVFKVTYPQFKNASADFNKKIADLVNAAIESQKKDGEANWKARYDTRSAGDTITQFPKDEEKFNLNVFWKPTQLSNQFISVLITISGYTGGAHGFETLSSFNYDVVKKEEIQLEDLFPSTADYLNIISDFSRKDLTDQFHKRLNIKTKADEANFKESVLPMMMDGTTPNLANFNVFTFTKNTIIIYFNQYQVAPYAMGQSTVFFPRK